MGRMLDNYNLILLCVEPALLVGGDRSSSMVTGYDG